MTILGDKVKGGEGEGRKEKLKKIVYSRDSSAVEKDENHILSIV